ncbi:GNAT family N-acetyltransferase [Sphingomonas xanthus]|uniref:GNAT family N-acetyltransferase n=1 Tax=Sphingomonas xanthus TaxID=2594473 RepID=A0A516ISH8_9SPHN|nr:GNAT family N-acetyltransferase [Sphingomonas xanthus]QDP19868.1 GNAT family N-acetyltransferase [Sphingomonas xanthus]
MAESVRPIHGQGKCPTRQIIVRCGSLLTHSECEQLRSLMLAAILHPASRYDAEQSRTWANNVPAIANLQERLAPQQLVLAVEEEVLQGFMSLADDGLIDLAFIAPEYQGTGLFAALLTDVERAASARGLAWLGAKASLNAVGPFQRRGFSVLDREDVTLPGSGRSLTRFHVEKPLT